MRFVSSIAPVTANRNVRQVTALSAVQAVRPVHAPQQTVPYIELNTANQGSVPIVEQKRYRDIPTVDRRKVCRRVSHQAVLVELRSGVDRRRHNIREGDVVEHIDEIA